MDFIEKLEKHKSYVKLLLTLAHFGKPELLLNSMYGSRKRETQTDYSGYR